MFVAWRDLRFAKGRFVLMGTVIVLITLLVGLLSGLTAGLARDNTSALTGLPADHIAFAQPADGQAVSFTGSTVTPKQWRELAGRPGVDGAEPIGISTLEAEAGRHTAAVSAFGVRPDSGLAPDTTAPGTAVLSRKAATELGVRAGDRLTLGTRTLTVSAVSGDASYSHTPVVWTDLGDWQRVTHSDGATIVALTTGPGADLAAADRAAGTDTTTVDGALEAIGSYQAENGSLQLMRGFLFVISAMVVGAFFTVWTIQRSADIAVLKALGSSTGYLLRDALGQAVLMLVGGTATGTALAALIGAFVPDSVPFVMEPLTTIGPAVVMTVLGVVGAALSIRRITAVDPLTALGSAR
ncbi:ABC transporter permease [Streptomyces sp. VRA16 Mangrove soil]|uniref:ABC transporter permease n=1 Tax=Streptomyces sp. VRA16 Mangrove soil TaxID=2817434 RepID=UPI001A9F8FC2|nr:ABC transporter permease [Streptomyces sp. VRA16 Mangrove soil]MBO1331269.1 ABC transporter permease [Streptomyces sp. VRA16 Mangrove soil]